MARRRSTLSVEVDSFSNINFLHSLKPTRIKLGLENISLLLECLGEPHRTFPAVLVGGTNGKGSVTAYISAILRSADLAVGTFYSPHLLRVNERIRVNGEEIPSAVLDAIIGELRRFHRRAPCTFFEYLTAAAAVHFERAAVDIAVFEVGLGGRLDATRLVNAAVTVITGVSRDHREHLGRTQRTILTEKLGIVRGGVPLVARLTTGALDEHARRYCAAEEAPFHNVSDEVEAAMVTMGPRAMVVAIETPERSYGELRTRMIGAPQVGNIATAVRAVEVLSGCARRGGRCPAAGTGSGYRYGESNGAGAAGLRRLCTVQTEAVRRGVESAFIAGRFQVLTGKPRIIVDVSHNEEALLASLKTLLTISPRERNVLVFGVLANKELGRFPHRALRASREVVLTPLRCGRGATAASLFARFDEAGGGDGGRLASVRTVRGVAEAIRTARGSLGPDDTLLILGSHLTVEEAAACL